MFEDKPKCFIDNIMRATQCLVLFCFRLPSSREEVTPFSLFFSCVLQYWIFFFLRLPPHYFKCLDFVIGEFSSHLDFYHSLGGKEGLKPNLLVLRVGCWILSAAHMLCCLINHNEINDVYPSSVALVVFQLLDLNSGSVIVYF